MMTGFAGNSSGVRDRAKLRPRRSVQLSQEIIMTLLKWLAAAALVGSATACVDNNTPYGSGYGSSYAYSPGGYNYNQQPTYYGAHYSNGQSTYYGNRQPTYYGYQQPTYYGR
jgi:hypothetical protein